MDLSPERTGFSSRCPWCRRDWGLPADDVDSSLICGYHVAELDRQAEAMAARRAEQPLALAG